MISEIKNILDYNPQYRDKLFCRGFLFSSRNDIEKEKFPFYGTWKHENINFKNKTFNLYVHNKTKFYINKTQKNIIILIGHAYNPFREEYDENKIINDLSVLENNSFFSFINELTGIFTLIKITNEGIQILNDATGMQMTYYGIVKDNVFVSTHAAIIGYLENLEMDAYVTKLINYKHYHFFGNHLPGDLSPYKKIKRLVPNHFVSILNGSIFPKRFWPLAKLKIDADVREVAKNVSNIMTDSLSLIVKKWNKPAISMTGGCDSKTTFSCLNDTSDKFKYFSYISSNEEEVDAFAAKKICDHFGLEHKIYTIPIDCTKYKDYEIIKKILEVNSGCIGKNNSNDVCKRIYFDNINDFDVEIKSWASEIGRAYYSKRFKKKTFPREITAKYLRTLYKVFFYDRVLIKQTDQIFDDYMKKYSFAGFSNEWQDLFFWEFRVSSWNSLVITGEHRYSFDITIPYNNRLLLEQLLSVNINERISDTVYSYIRKMNNPQLENLDIDVVNVKHTNKRAYLERGYLDIMSKL